MYILPSLASTSSPAPRRWHPSASWLFPSLFSWVSSVITFIRFSVRNRVVCAGPLCPSLPCFSFDSPIIGTVRRSGGDVSNDQLVNTPLLDPDVTTVEVLGWSLLVVGAVAG
jgi:hypothetical protein